MDLFVISTQNHFHEFLFAEVDFTEFLFKMRKQFNNLHTQCGISWIFVSLLKFSVKMNFEIFSKLSLQKLVFSMVMITFQLNCKNIFWRLGTILDARSEIFEIDISKAIIWAVEHCQLLIQIILKGVSGGQRFQWIIVVLTFLY